MLTYIRQNLRSPYWGIAISIALLCQLPSGVQAQLGIKSTFSSRAQGLNGSQLPSLSVWPGSGTNLSFIPTGEFIKKVWLDNPSPITVDFDSPLCSTQQGAGGGFGSGSCADSTAMIVHLRRTVGINFPNLPQTYVTLLTVVTEKQGQRKMYQFRVFLGHGSPEYAALVVYPDSTGAPTLEINDGRRVQLDKVGLGLQVASSKGLLGANANNQSLRAKVQNFLALARNGLAIPDAAQQAGVSMGLITKLAELGTESQFGGPNTNIPVPAPISPLPPQGQNSGNGIFQVPAPPPDFKSPSK
jgi:hypothetical protein